MLLTKSKRIALLQQRTERCCCRSCGSELVIKRIIFNDIPDVKTEIFCSVCNAIEFGVEKEIYLCAKHFVEETDFNYFSFLDSNEKTKQMNVAKVCDILTWTLQNLGVVGDGGFQVPISYDASMSSSCMEIGENELLELLQKVVSEHDA